MLTALLQIFGSLRLTVILLSASMVLIFFGTIDQVEYGIWHTQKLYFESFVVAWQYPALWPAGDQLTWLRIPMFGGYTIGSLMLINLTVAYTRRFSLKAAKIGLYAIHSGLMLLIVSELLTDLLAVESQMTVPENGRANYSQTVRENELVLIDRSHPDHDQVHAIPAEILKPGHTLDIPDTSLRARVLHFYPNAQLVRTSDASSPANRGVATKMGVTAIPRAPDYSEKAINTATAYIEILDGDASLGTWLLANVLDERFPPQTVQTYERDYEIALRFQRHYYPFEIELLDFAHDKYPGTDIPFNFSSKVITHHPEPAKNQQALIYMNHPLRYEGLTFYQASFSPDETATILQVVRNPGWLLPYFSVLLMGLGMTYQFGLHFIKYLNKRKPA
ncbi:MAG: Cytochrome c biogenesis protein Ccs1 [Opitutia bacterium UBA7350]|nr:MAG: Cytochrome c biogenesis protein Ccs1 [Opitutae bacterium UBA7350]